MLVRTHGLVGKQIKSFLKFIYIYILKKLFCFDNQSKTDDLIVISYNYLFKT